MNKLNLEVGCSLLYALMLIQLYYLLYLLLLFTGRSIRDISCHFWVKWSAFGKATKVTLGVIALLLFWSLLLLLLLFLFLLGYCCCVVVFIVIVVVLVLFWVIVVLVFVQVQVVLAVMKQVKNAVAKKAQNFFVWSVCHVICDQVVTCFLFSPLKGDRSISEISYNLFSVRNMDACKHPHISISGLLNGRPSDNELPTVTRTMGFGFWF